MFEGMDMLQINGLFTALFLAAALFLNGSAGPTEPEAVPLPEETVAVAEPEPVVGLVPRQEEPVELSYFDDAAFIGNSLVDGFRMFSGVKNCDYYAATSKTIFDIGDYLDGMAGRKYGKIYLLLGINEIGYSMDTLMDAYGEVLDRLMADHPEAAIYAMGLSPVSAAKDASSSVFTMDNIRTFNERLLLLAEEKGCCYIDLCDALGGEDGFLPAKATTDGIHFTASQYKVWLEYLQYHYVPLVE